MLTHPYKLKVTHWSIQRLLCFLLKIEPDTRENTVADVLCKALIKALAVTQKCRPRH